MIEITTTTGKIAKVSPDEFWRAVYYEVQKLYENNRRQIYLEVNGENEFVIVPTNRKSKVKNEEV